MENAPGLPVTRSLTVTYVLSLVIAALMIAVSLAGILGESPQLQHRPEAGWGVITGPGGILVPGFFAQDVLALVVGLPALIGSLWLARRGRLIGLLLWPGALFSVLYTYVHYLVGAPFGPEFLPHVALVVLSGIATIRLIAAIDADEVRRRLARAVPPRTVGGILIGLAILTLGQDAGGAISTTLSGSPIEPVARHVWIADLTLSVPATFVGGLLLWRRVALGYTTAAGLLLAFSITPIELATMLALQPAWTDTSVAGDVIVGLLVFAAISAAPLALFPAKRSLNGSSL